MSSVENGPIYVSALQAPGVNNSNRHFAKISGHIESKLTGEQLPLLVDGIAPEDTNGIPPKCQFFSQVLFREPASEREGIVVEKFLQGWEEFTLVFQADGEVHTHRFSKREVLDTIERFRQDITFKPVPQVTRTASQ